MASEADDDEPSRDLGYEGLESQDNLVPEKDPVMYSLPARKLLMGDITDDIPENVKVVRIFTSSTFTGILIKNNIWLSTCNCTVHTCRLRCQHYRY